MNQLWTRGQQVILSYEEASVVSRHRELWPGIPYWWGDQVKPQELIHYLEHMKRCGRPGEWCGSVTRGTCRAHTHVIAHRFAFGS